MVVIWAVSGSHAPRDDDFYMGFSPVGAPLVYSVPYTHSEAADIKQESAQIGSHIKRGCVCSPQLQKKWEQTSN